MTYDAFAKGEWRHVAGVSSATGLKIYVDGTFMASTPETFQPTDIAPYIEVALTGYSRWAGSYDWVLGMFDELRVWSVARTQEEIAACLHTPLAGTEDGLLVYHPLDQASGDVLLDVTGHGYDGDRNDAQRQTSQAPLIQMSSVALLGADGIAIDVDGDGLPGGILVSLFSVDTTAPRIVGIDPDLGACPVTLPPSALLLRFDDDMMEATLGAENALLVASGGDGSFGDGNEVTFTLPDGVYDPLLRTVTFEFESPLPDDTYVFELADTVLNIVGAPLDGEYPNSGGIDDPLPSGDGNPGGPFTIYFDVDSTNDCNANGRADVCDLIHELFSYPGFAVIDDLNLVGAAAQAGDVLRLVPTQNWSAGAAWYAQKQRVDSTFETVFQFNLNPSDSNAADGFAFVIQNDSDTALGGDASDLGFAGIPNSLAVEFDTFEGSDPSLHRISVQTAGLEPNSSHWDYSLGSTTDIPAMWDA